jgi:o-succinylbenzoate synthase
MIGRSRAFELPLSAPVETASGTIRTRRGLLVRVEAEAGDDGEGERTSDDGDENTARDAVGVGEATPLPGWTETFAECGDAVDAALDRLATAGPRAALAETDGAPAARHGLSLALADLDARAADEPLYRHLRSSDRERREDDERRVESVPVNATLGDGSVEETVAAAREAVGAGFRTLKVKVGARPVADDAARLDAIEEGVGADVRLRADANGGWSREEAIRAIDAFPGLEYVEQPLAADDLAGHADLRASATIALDETLAEHSVAEVLDADAADVLVLKPMVLGGADRCVTAAARARDAGVDPVVTTTIDGAVARTAAVHLAAGVDVDRACGLATADRLGADVAPDPAVVENGTISVPQGGGHGVTVAWT